MFTYKIGDQTFLLVNNFCWLQKVYFKWKKIKIGEITSNNLNKFDCNEGLSTVDVARSRWLSYLNESK